jgi:hypothetical protein
MSTIRELSARCVARTLLTVGAVWARATEEFTTKNTEENVKTSKRRNEEGKKARSHEATNEKLVDDRSSPVLFCVICAICGQNHPQISQITHFLFFVLFASFVVQPLPSAIETATDRGYRWLKEMKM